MVSGRVSVTPMACVRPTGGVRVMNYATGKRRSLSGMLGGLLILLHAVDLCMDRFAPVAIVLHLCCGWCICARCHMQHRMRSWGLYWFPGRKNYYLLCDDFMSDIAFSIFWIMLIIQEIGI